MSGRVQQNHRCEWEKVVVGGGGSTGALFGQWLTWKVTKSEALDDAKPIHPHLRQYPLLNALGTGTAIRAAGQFNAAAVNIWYLIS